MVAQQREGGRRDTGFTDTYTNPNQKQLQVTARQTRCHGEQAEQAHAQPEHGAAGEPICESANGNAGEHVEHVEGDALQHAERGVAELKGRLDGAGHEGDHGTVGLRNN